MLKKSFVHLKERWDSDLILKYRIDYLVDDVYLSVELDNMHAEIKVAWYSFGSVPAPSLTIDGPDFWAIYYLADVLNYLSAIDYMTLTPEKFCEYLKIAAFIDETKRERPS